VWRSACDNSVIRLDVDLGKKVLFSEASGADRMNMLARTSCCTSRWTFMALLRIRDILLLDTLANEHAKI